jgi:hypothetical protein
MIDSNVHEASLGVCLGECQPPRRCFFRTSFRLGFPDGSGESFLSADGSTWRSASACELAHLRRRQVGNAKRKIRFEADYQPIYGYEGS